jgi:phosphoribosylformylglycinamidine synthase
MNRNPLLIFLSFIMLSILSFPGSAQQVTLSGNAKGAEGKSIRPYFAGDWYALHGAVGTGVPKVNAPRARALYEALHRAITGGFVASCHDCADGGLGVALAETAFAGGLGMDVDLKLVPARDIARDDHLLFSETPSRFVATVRPEQRAAFEAALQAHPCACIGTVTGDGRLRMTGRSGKAILAEDIADLKAAWQAPLNF